MRSLNNIHIKWKDNKSWLSFENLKSTDSTPKNIAVNNLWEVVLGITSDSTDKNIIKDFDNSKISWMYYLDDTNKKCFKWTYFNSTVQPYQDSTDRISMSVEFSTNISKFTGNIYVPYISSYYFDSSWIRNNATNVNDIIKTDIKIPDEVYNAWFDRDWTFAMKIKIPATNVVPTHMIVWNNTTRVYALHTAFNDGNKLYTNGNQTINLSYDELRNEYFAIFAFEVPVANRNLSTQQATVNIVSIYKRTELTGYNWEKLAFIGDYNEIIKNINSFNIYATTNEKRWLVFNTIWFYKNLKHNTVVNSYELYRYHNKYTELASGVSFPTNTRSSLIYTTIYSKFDFSSHPNTNAYRIYKCEYTELPKRFRITAINEIPWKNITLEPFNIYFITSIYSEDFVFESIYSPYEHQTLIPIQFMNAEWYLPDIVLTKEMLNGQLQNTLINLQGCNTDRYFVSKLNTTRNSSMTYSRSGSTLNFAFNSEWFNHTTNKVSEWVQFVQNAVRLFENKWLIVTTTSVSWPGGV